MWLIDVDGNAVKAALVSKILIIGCFNDAFEVKADIPDENNYFTLATFDEGTAEENRTAAIDFVKNLVDKFNKEG